MSDQDPNELLTICDSIIEDGELTYQELYQLAEWLNGHPEGMRPLAGSLLVEPLEIAWADGKITKTESRQLSRLLLQIRKEAAKRDADHLASGRGNCVPDSPDVRFFPVQSFPPSRSRLASSHTGKKANSTRLKREMAPESILVLLIRRRSP